MSDATNKRAEEEYRLPDCLQGLNVNWAMYTPPGADKNHGVSNYEAHMKPALEKARHICEDARDANAEKDYLLRDLIDLRSRLAEDVKDATQLCEKAKIDGGAANLSNSALSLIKTIDVRISVLEMEKVPENEVTADIEFFRNFEEFVHADQDADRMLYAMVLVDAKYRVKIFREAYKKVNRIWTLSEIIFNSRSRLKAVLFEKGGLMDNEIKFFKGLCVGYVAIAKYMKQLKRRVDREGASALVNHKFEAMLSLMKSPFVGLLKEYGKYGTQL